MLAWTFCALVKISSLRQHLYSCQPALVTSRAVSRWPRSPSVSIVRSSWLDGLMGSRLASHGIELSDGRRRRVTAERVAV
jgi:hypothetical protein